MPRDIEMMRGRVDDGPFPRQGGKAKGLRPYHYLRFLFWMSSEQLGSLSGDQRLFLLEVVCVEESTPGKELLHMRTNGRNAESS